MRQCVCLQRGEEERIRYFGNTCGYSRYYLLQQFSLPYMDISVLGAVYYNFPSAAAPRLLYTLKYWTVNSISFCWGGNSCQEPVNPLLPLLEEESMEICTMTDVRTSPERAGAKWHISVESLKFQANPQGMSVVSGLWKQQNYTSQEWWQEQPSPCQFSSNSVLLTCKITFLYL